MKTDCLLELENIWKTVSVWFLFNGTSALFNLSIGNGRKSEWDYWSDIDAINLSLIRSDLPSRLEYEIRANLFEAANPKWVLEYYKTEFAKRIINKNEVDEQANIRQCKNINLPQETIDRYLYKMNMMFFCYKEGITDEIEARLEKVEKELGGVPKPQRPRLNATRTNQQRKDERDRETIKNAVTMWESAVSLGLVDVEAGGGYQWLKSATLYGYFADVVTVKLGIRRKNEQRAWRLFDGVIINHKELLITAQTRMYELDKGDINKPDGYDLVDSITF